MHDPVLIEKFCSAIDAPSEVGTPILPTVDTGASADSMPAASV
jgi:hypothetical protein